jgi:outer membrane protein, heavy metal efflux system
MLRSLILSSILVALPLSAAAAQRPLSLGEVYELARDGNPMVRAAQAAAAAVAAREPSAGLPPDPEIQLGVMNLSIPGLTADMPGSMLPSVQAMQMIPFPGKLRLSGDVARQSTAMAVLQAEEAWWDVRERAAMSFYEVYRIDRQTRVMEETLEWLTQFEEVASAMYSVGSGRQSDVLRAGVEVARMRAEIARMRAMRTSAAATLNALLDRRGDAALPGVAFTPLPGRPPSSAELERWAEVTRPSLAQGRTGVELAQTRQALARREIWPDLTLGVQYGQRPAEMGTERMGSLMVGFTVPVFAGQRQLRMREETAAMEQMARAELGDRRVQVNARITELLAGLERGRTLLELYRAEVLPQAETTVASALASYRTGRVDFMTLLDAQMTLNGFRQEMFDLLAEYGTLVAALEATVGRELPPTTEMIEDEPMDGSSGSDERRSS